MCVPTYTRFFLRVGGKACTAGSKVEQLLPLLVVHVANNLPEHSMHTAHNSLTKYHIITVNVPFKFFNGATRVRM